jgi:hypothetical protein
LQAYWAISPVEHRRHLPKSFPNQPLSSRRCKIAAGGLVEQRSRCLGGKNSLCLVYVPSQSSCFLGQQHDFFAAANDELVAQSQKRDCCHALDCRGQPYPCTTKRRHRVGAWIKRAFEQHLRKCGRQRMTACDHLGPRRRRLVEGETHGAFKPARR